MTKFPLSAMATRWCQGDGLEIGASAHNSFGLRAKNVAPKDDEDFEFYKKAQIELCGEFSPVDIWAEGDSIPLECCSQDFIISSHCIEHMPDPVGAIREWYRLVRPGGIIYVVVPLRDALESDKGRELTTLQHLQEDFNNHAMVDTHPLEHSQKRRCHYHVWTLQTFLGMVAWAREALILPRIDVVETAENDDKVGNGFVVVMRKPVVPVSSIDSDGQARVY